MRFADCMKEGLVRKDPEAHLKVKESILISGRFLEQAEGNLKMKYYIACELLAYNSAFHAARALLFLKGYRERSHACMITALISLYEKDDELITHLNTFDQLRLSRHNVQYGGSLVNEKQAIAVIEFARAFLDIARKRLNGGGIR